ncbi:MAG TPA: low temperature requirement protein A [Trebonia sp.]|nr:low temperature requirement protein A [Trebonia sp.]
MSGRDPSEKHRTSTPLELLVDLTYVVAVARAAVELRDALGVGHTGHALGSYCLVFFGLWWAWVNSTWFASAYDTDDVPYRLLTLVQMVGVLVFSAGIPPATQHNDFPVVIGGYVTMRMALVTQVLRAAAGDPSDRQSLLRYSVSVTVIQLCWILWLYLPWPGRAGGLVLLVAAELGAVAWAQLTGPGLPWHPGHIADRYGQFTIIVFGEVISAVASAANTAVTDKRASPGLLTIAASGLMLVFALWWSYFKHDAVREIKQEIRESMREQFARAVAHYVIFAAAALGAGLEVAIQPLTNGARVSPVFAAFAMAIPVATTIVVLALLTARQAPGPSPVWLTMLTAVLLLAVAAATPLVTLPAASLMMVVLVGLPLAYYLTKDGNPFAPRSPAS